MGLDRPGGVLVEAVQPSGPAERAGLKRGDVIYEVDHKAIDDVQGLRFRLATREIGEKVVMAVHRHGKAMKLPFDLQAPPEIPPRDTSVLDNQCPLSGIKVANLSPAVAAEVGFEELEVGVLVIEIAARFLGLAHRAAARGRRPDGQRPEDRRGRGPQAGHGPGARSLAH